MTRKGWHTIIVREEDYQIIKNLSEKRQEKICKTVSEIIKEYIENHKGEIL